MDFRLRGNDKILKLLPLLETFTPYTKAKSTGYAKTILIYESTTFVPSKSKLNLISSKPARCITWRNLLRSEA